MSAKPAAIPFFGDAYLADTTHLSTEEHGAYFLLLLAAWRQDDCGLPNDPRKLARIAGLSPRKWASIADTVLAFWTVENGRIYQARLRKEWHFSCAKSEQNRKSAVARWNKQATEKKQSDACGRICEGNAPPPPPLGDTDVSPPSYSPPKPKSGKRTPLKGSRLPAGWQPALTPKYQAIVAAWPAGMLERELTKFRNHAADKGRLSKDWQAAFRTWIDNADDWNRNDRPRTTDRRSSPVDRRDGIARACDEIIAGSADFAGGYEDGAGEAERGAAERYLAGDG